MERLRDFPEKARHPPILETGGEIRFRDVPELGGSMQIAVRDLCLEESRMAYPGTWDSLADRLGNRAV